MDFGALPPEINSGRMYAGPGSAPLSTAAATWDELAAELHAAAAGYHSVTSQLTSGPWQGPASVAMMSAVAPYLAWLRATAVQAEQSATQVRAAVGAYETAHTLTVPPPVIAANRALLLSLVTTNVLGQNTPAIAATEAHYGEMWAQDAAAMYGYAAASAAASKLTPFTPPPAITKPAGAASPEIVSAGTMSVVPRALQGLASPSSPASSYLAALDSLSGHARTASSAMTFMVGAANLARTMNVAGPAGVAAVGSGTNAGALGAPTLTGPGTASGPAVSAGIGRAASVGALSVPPNWVATAPVTSPIAAALPSTGGNAAPVAGLAGMPVIPATGIAGRGVGQTNASRFMLRPKMVPRWPG